VGIKCLSVYILAFVIRLAITCCVCRIVMWPVRPYRVLPRYLIKGNIFGERNIEHKIRVLAFCTTFWNIPLPEKNSAIHHRCTLVSV
jgi:hypothetical protein